MKYVHQKISYIYFLPLRLPSKQTYFILPVDRYITKIAGTLYPGGHLIIKNRYFNSSVTTRLRHLLLCLTHSSMTSLLIHTVAQCTRPSCRPKINNKPLKKFLSLEVSWVKVVKNCKILTFNVNFLCQKLSKSFSISFHWTIALYFSEFFTV